MKPEKNHGPFGPVPSHRHSTVNCEDLACNVSGGGTAEEGNGSGDFLGLAEAGERNLGESSLPDFLVENGSHVGLDESRSHHVDRDTAAGDLLGECFGETDHAGLAGGVVGLAGKSHEAADRADIDDAAGTLLDHRAEDRADEVEGSLKIRVEHGVPLL